VYSAARLPRIFLVVAASAAAACICAARVLAGDWQASELGLAAAWQVTQGNPAVVVAIVDTGVEADHPALRGRVLPGWDFVHGQAGAVDDNGHGTALAGIVAQTCPRCTILPVKALDGNETGDWSTIATGIRWAADQGAQVINVSIGAPHAPGFVADAVAYAIASGAIVVAAAGNDGLDEPFYPALYPGVVSVAGVQSDLSRYSWSNFGSWITIAAPGCAATAWLGGGAISAFCGTSTAAPFVAGVAGLARSFRPTLTDAEFAAALCASARPLPDPATAAHGEVDANGLLLALGAPPSVPQPGTPPAIEGRPQVAHRLVAFAGRWQHAATYTVRWERSRDGTEWTQLAYGHVYVPRRADLRYRLRIAVTGTNVRGTATALSPGSEPVAAPAIRRKS
jgi:subtilisin family serine protease